MSAPPVCLLEPAQPATRAAQYISCRILCGATEPKARSLSWREKRENGRGANYHTSLGQFVACIDHRHSLRPGQCYPQWRTVGPITPIDLLLSVFVEHRPLKRLALGQALGHQSLLIGSGLRILETCLSAGVVRRGVRCLWHAVSVVVVFVVLVTMQPLKYRVGDTCLS